MKRFSETTKWDDPWFRKLKPRYKAFLQYIWDRCDSAGVWVVDIDLATTFVGEKLDGPEALKVFEGRVIDTQDGKWLVTGFIPFQWGELKFECKPHRQVIGLVQKHGLERNGKGYRKGNVTVSDTHPDTLQDKDKDKDKKKGKDSEDLGLDFPQNLRTPEFMAAWDKWVPFRQKMRGCKDWVALFQEQLSWLGTFPTQTAISVLEQSIRNGWQGLFEIKGSNQVRATPKPHVVGSGNY